MINILCDNALVNGLGCQKKPVTASIVREAIARPHGARARALVAMGVGVDGGGGRPPARCSLRRRTGSWSFVSAETQAQLPALPQAPPRVVPVAAGGAESLARPGEGGVATAVIVEEGDSLLVLARDVYGFADERVMQVVLAANPDHRETRPAARRQRRPLPGHPGSGGGDVASAVRGGAVRLQAVWYHRYPCARSSAG